MRLLQLFVAGLTIVSVSSFRASGYTVSGTVFESDSVTTVAGARIGAFAKGLNDAVIPPVCAAQTVTGQNGSYTVTIDGSAEKYYIMARCNEISNVYGLKIFKWVSAATATANVIMSVAEDGFTNITGTITNTGGAPVSGAKVVLRSKVSTGGTARFNVDSAVTGANGGYAINKAQVKVPETTGEKVASLHIYAAGYGDGVIDPLAMSGPTMVADYTLGGTGIVISEENKCLPYGISVFEKNLTITVLHEPARMSIYKTSGVAVLEKAMQPGVHTVSLQNLYGRQILIIRLVHKNRSEQHTIPVVF